MKLRGHPRSCCSLKVLLPLLVSTCCLAQKVSSLELQRRTFYADKHFATRGVPGSQTDRGKVYIHLGPPDNIKEVKATPTGDSFPWEEWKYRSIPGIGKDIYIDFIDTSLDYGYKMIPPAEDANPKKAAQARRRFELIQKRISKLPPTDNLHPDTNAR